MNCLIPDDEQKYNYLLQNKFVSVRVSKYIRETDKSPIVPSRLTNVFSGMSSDSDSMNKRPGSLFYKRWETTLDWEVICLFF